MLLQWLADLVENPTQTHFDAGMSVLYLALLHAIAHGLRWSDQMSLHRASSLAVSLSGLVSLFCFSVAILVRHPANVLL